MGLFGSRKITTVGTTVSRVIEDEAMPNSIQSGVLKSLFAEDGGDIPAYILEEFVGSIGIRAERMYDYAQRNYPHGLPSGQYVSATKGREEVEALLSAHEGQLIQVDYCRFGPANNLHVGWMRLIADHGYDPVTNELGVLSAEKGKPVYLRDAIVVVPEDGLELNAPGSLDQWGPAASSGYTPDRDFTPAVRMLQRHSPVQVDPFTTSEYILVKYVWEEPIADPDGWRTGLLEGTFKIPITGFEDDDDYFQVRYTVPSTGEIKYWMYLAGSGTYPELDAIFHEEDEVAGTFFPFSYFRYNKTSTVEDETTEVFKTTKKMLGDLGIDYKMVGDAINENPDIKDVEQAMLVMAVPANTENELERRYLFDFFDRLYGASGEQFSSQTHADIRTRLLNDRDLIKSSIIIQDRQFKMALSNGGIFKQLVTGSIGPVGSHDSGRTVQWIHQTYDGPEGMSYPIAVPLVTHYYRRQISTGMYAEVQVQNLQMRYHIWGKYTVTADEEDNILLVPLDRSITEDYLFKDREILYARSLHYVFNSRVVTKLKWYQSNFFKIVMIVVAVIIPVFSMGAVWQSLAAAVAAGSITMSAALWAIMTKLLTGILISLALKLFVKVVGVDIAFIAAIVAAAYGAYTAFEASSIAGAPWAGELLSLSNGLFSAVSEEIGELMGDLMGEASEFSKYMAEQMKLLDSAKDLLKTSNLLNPYIIFGESPETFYNRTVHSGNIGVLSIGAISNYVDIALTLPKLNETIGERINE